MTDDLKEPGQWYGNGTDGTHAVYSVHRHGYRGYWWYVRPDGEIDGVAYCGHAHKTKDAGLRCGQKNAAARNRSLRRVGGGRFASGEEADR